MNRLTVVHPGDIDTRTGGFGYDRRLIAGLRAAGRSVATLALPGDYPAPSSADVDAAARLIAALAPGEPVLVDGLAGAVLPDVLRAEAARRPVVMLCHHPLALETGLDVDRAAALATSERAALAACHAVVVTSAPTADTLVRAFGVPADRITVALPGTDPRPPARRAGDPPVLLTVATLTRRKAHDVLIAALGGVRDLAWTARFVGGADFEPAWTAELRRLAEETGVAERVAFVGSVDDPDRAYAAADLFVLPSRYEGYGMAFAEALAHGLPVIAARAGAVPSVVPETAGILVPPDDAAELSAALRRVLTDTAVREALAAGAHAAGSRLPTWEATAMLVAGVLDEVTR